MAKGLAQAAADERLLDFIQLYLGYRAAAQAGVQEPHMVAGWALARTLDSAFQDSLQEFIQPYLDDPGAGLWMPLYRKTLVGAPSPDRLARYAEWADAFLLWARRNAKVWQDAWDSAKSKRKALQIHDVTQDDDPSAQLRKLAALPSISGMIRIRKWLEAGAGQVGTPLSAVESVSADAQTVKSIASKLSTVQTALDASIPMSEDHTNLQEQKAKLNKQVKDVVDSSADGAAVLAAAVSSQTTSAVAAKARLNDEQVRAMLAEGKVLITAGAGAGKTAVMAAKVAYHVLEQGMSPDQVLAVSFTRKAATELKERVEKLYGIQSDTISTTHTLAGNVLREFMPGARAVLARTSPRNSDKLMRLAYAQIALSDRSTSSNYGYGGRSSWRGRRAAYPSQGTPYWKEPAGEWFNLGIPPQDRDGKPIGRNALSAVVEVAQAHSETWQDIKAKADQNPMNMVLKFGAAFYAAYEWLKQHDPELGPYRDFNDWLADAADMLEKNPQALASLQRRFKVVLVDEAQDLNRQQQRLFDQIADKAKVYAQIGDDRQCVSVDTLVDTPAGKVRAEDLKEGDQVLAYRNGRVVYQSVRHVVPSSWEEGYLIKTESGRELLMSPNHRLWSTKDLDYDGLDDPFEILLTHEVNGTEFLGVKYDSYREALQIAESDVAQKSCLLWEQMRFAGVTLLLHEAQHLVLGEQVPVVMSDKSVVLDSIVSITKVPGKFVDLDVDDASCFFGNGILSHNSIYKFRGAIPEQFTGLPQKGFQVYGLTFNYRSGKNIVDAAEKLIAYNGNRQIPKVCRANPGRTEDGLIEMVRPETHDDGALLAAEEISNSCSPEAGGSPQDFGILVRNNAEADAYALALMSKGIPFRSRTSYFDKPAVKALLAWCQLAVSKDPGVVNAAVLKAHQRPGYYLGDKFVEGLQQYCPRGQDYAQYLIGGGTAYMTGYNLKNIALYAESIQKLQKFQGSASDLINAVLGVQGSKGGSFRDSLVEDVDPEELMEGTDKLEVTPEEIIEAATAPIAPLIKMAAKFEDPEKWLAFVARMVAANDKTLKKEEDTTPAVRIDTVHSWKGLQAKHVYVVMSGGGVFPSSYALLEHGGDEQSTALDEERRLAYVAITRGEDAVTVICPATNYRNKPAEVPRFVLEACIQDRAGQTPSMSKQASWVAALDGGVTDFLGSVGFDASTSIEEAWGDLL